MVEFIDLSLDLETWHNAPGADLRSIGMSPILIHGKFHGKVQESFYRAVESRVVQILPDGIQITEYGLIRHPKTIKWWGEQGQAAQDAFKNSTELSTAIMELLGYLQRITGNDDPSKCKNLRIWGHGSHYDCPILAAAIAALGLDEMWFYRAPRDTRTIFDNAGIEDHTAYITSFAGSDFIKHHALYDAQAQGGAVGQCLETMIERRRLFNDRLAVLETNMSSDGDLDILAEDREGARHTFRFAVSTDILRKW